MEEDEEMVMEEWLSIYTGLHTIICCNRRIYRGSNSPSSILLNIRVVSVRNTSCTPSPVAADVSINRAEFSWAKRLASRKDTLY